MKLELHYDKPPLLHNDDKKKRQLLKQIVADLEEQLPKFKGNATESSDFVKKFFDIRETVLPHGNMYYRVQTKLEHNDKKFVISENGEVCKMGCTENKLIKWCAKCNDREKLRRKEENQLKNNERLVGEKLQEKHIPINGSNIPTMQNGGHVSSSENDSSKAAGKKEIETLNLKLEKLDVFSAIRSEEMVKKETGVTTLGELTDYVKGLTLHDIVYEHVYAEGICFTVADVILFVYVYFLLVSQSSKVINS